MIYVSCPKSSLTKNQDNIPILSQIKFDKESWQHTYLVPDQVWQRIMTRYISCPRSSLTKNQDNICILSQIKFDKASWQDTYQHLDRFTVSPASSRTYNWRHVTSDFAAHSPTASQLTYVRLMMIGWCQLTTRHLWLCCPQSYCKLTTSDRNFTSRQLWLCCPQPASKLATSNRNFTSRQLWLCCPQFCNQSYDYDQLRLPTPAAAVVAAEGKSLASIRN